MHKSLASLYLLVAVSLYSGLVHAQQQVQSGLTEKGLTVKQKFQEELDNAILRAYEGDRDAQFRVGALFNNDQFAEPDYEKAVYWYRQAARQNHALAQYNLGHHYLNGIGVLQSTEDAMQWWLKAARLGHPLSQFNVGRAYYLGIGLPADLKKSKYWFEKAAENQEPKSIEILAELNWDNIPQEPLASVNNITSVVTKVDTPLNTIATHAEPKVVTQPLQKQVASIKTNSTPTNTVSIEPIEKAVATQALSKDNKTITLYTSPSVRSILISMVYEPNDLEIVKHMVKWTSIRHKKGFPVWVHKDFVSVNGSQATLTGNSVNVRAVPLIIQGSIVGKLNKGDKVTIINKTEKWYRVTSPAHFIAWVKTEELKQQRAITNATETRRVLPNTTVEAPLVINSNAWLFQQDSTHFTLQLASFDSEESANNFVANSSLAADTNLHRFKSASNDITWTYFLYGSYPNKNKAQAEQKSINTKDAWVRNIGKVQQNRCIAWKKQLPTPKELNMYCTPSSN